MPRSRVRSVVRTILVLLGIGLVGAVAWLIASWGHVPDRNPPPPELANQLSIPGIPNAWMWADTLPPIVERWQQATPEEMRGKYPSIMGIEHSYLAISGGADEGAYGAGVLCGWTAAGTRPEFTLVTGVSTGALTAPLAFLGPEYDNVLHEVYTTYSTDDLVRKRNPLEAVTSDALAGTDPLRELVERYMSQDVLDAIAAEYRKGRILLIGTTNLDAGRPVLWRIGRIAASDSPDRLKLFHDVLIASASIPIAFPPVYIKAVGPDGVLYDEMHVDGGATSQIFLYPIGVDWREVLEKMEVPGRPKLYLINNAKVKPVWSAVDPGNLMSIGRQSILSLIRTQGQGDLFRLYLGAVRDGLKFHLAAVPTSFDAERTEPFDPVYMGKLFDLGYEEARSGYPWARHPPSYRVD